MRTCFWMILFVAFFLFHSTVHSQIKFSGYFQSSLYGLENQQENQQWDSYQALQLRLSPENYANLYLNSYIRLAYRGEPGEWDDRAYNLYLNWQHPGRKLTLRLGRQFVYSGVMNGTVDGLLVKVKPISGAYVKLLVGTEATASRNFKVRPWDNGNVLGGLLSYQLPWEMKVDVSYFQKAQLEETIWQQTGVDLSGKAFHQFYYQARVYYNLLSSEYQSMRYRLTYNWNRWTISGEYNDEKPRILEGSYFQRFEIHAYRQVRSALFYQLKNYQLGLQYLYTMYEDENNNQIILTAGSNWGALGVVFQNGYGGDNLGVYGDIQYPIIPAITLRLHSSYYNYQRYATDISEDATAYSLGLQFNLSSQLQLLSEIQGMNNSYYKQDIRALFRLHYLFHN